jgi:hypothetical protein
MDYEIRAHLSHGKANVSGQYAGFSISRRDERDSDHGCPIEHLVAALAS